jgi:hypothetical protein
MRACVLVCRECARSVCAPVPHACARSCLRVHACARLHAPIVFVQRWPSLAARLWRTHELSDRSCCHVFPTCATLQQIARAPCRLVRQSVACAVGRSACCATAIELAGTSRVNRPSQLVQFRPTDPRPLHGTANPPCTALPPQLRPTQWLRWSGRRIVRPSAVSADSIDSSPPHDSC